MSTPPRYNARMNPTTPATRPMAIPFKTDHFRLERQAALERQITASPLFGRLRKNLPEKGILDIVRDMGPTQMPLPEGACGKLDRAVAAIRTRARLGIPIQNTLVLGDDKRPTCVAHRHEGTLHLIVTGPLLECGDEALLRHRIATACFWAFHPLNEALQMLLNASAPMDLELWVAVIECCRLSSYMGECFAVACTGDIGAALRAGFMARGGADPAAAGIDLRQFGEAQMASGHFSMLAQVLSGTADIGWLPAKPAVLDAFMASEVYRACDGIAGGMPRAAFEAAVLGLDRRAHPPLEGPLPSEVGVFVEISGLLVACALIEATGPVTPARLAPALEVLETDADGMEKIRSGIGWDPMEPESSLPRFAAALEGTRRRWANLHSVEIFNRALIAALAESGGEFHDAMEPVLEQAGALCGLTPPEVRAIVETFAERAKAATRED